VTEKELIVLVELIELIGLIGIDEFGSRNAAFDELRRDKVGRNCKVQRAWRIECGIESGRQTGEEYRFYDKCFPVSYPTNS